MHSEMHGHNCRVESIDMALPLVGCALCVSALHKVGECQLNLNNFISSQMQDFVVRCCWFCIMFLKSLFAHL